MASLPANTIMEGSNADESVETMVAAFHEECEVMLPTRTLVFAARVSISHNDAILFLCEQKLRSGFTRDAFDSNATEVSSAYPHVLMFFQVKSILTRHAIPRHVKPCAPLCPALGATEAARIAEALHIDQFGAEGLLLLVFETSSSSWKSASGTPRCRRPCYRSSKAPRTR